MTVRPLKKTADALDGTTAALVLDDHVRASDPGEWTAEHVAAARSILDDERSAHVSFIAVRDILLASDYKPESLCREIIDAAVKDGGQ